MNKPLFKLLLGVFMLTNLNVLNAQRNVIDFNVSWKFGNTSLHNAISAGFDDSGWETLNLPHTWNGLDGQDGGNNLFRGARWYRKSFVAETSWQGKKVFLRFGAANMKTDVYINGQTVGTHIGAYAAFIFDISEFLEFGEDNIIAVRVDNSSGIDAAPLSGDFSFFGGITRNVELIVTDPLFISPLDYASPGVYLTPHNISEAQADLNIKVLVGNHYEESKDVEVEAFIKDKMGNTIKTVKTNVTVDPNTVINTSMDTDIQSPTLWNGVHNPYLYSVVVTLRTNDNVTDKVEQPLGFRTFAVDLNSGFILNGSNYNLHGVCLHEDRPDIGRAISNEQRKEDLGILQDLGCTYIRLVHSQHGKFNYEYCDSIGMVLSTEVPLVNRINSSAAFTENSKNQLRELIKQNYNHPSVMFWGLYNEVNFHDGPSPASLIDELNTLAHELDSTRFTTGAAQKDEAETHWIVDVCGWNKYMGWYDGSFDDYASWADWLRSAHPSTKIGMSEYGAGASIHHHQEVSIRPNPGGPFHPEEYQANYHEAYYQAMLERPFIWSTAVWVAFDFASDYRAEGDALGINDKGLVTRDRKVKKDAFYFYKAHWTKEPFAYISSRRFTEHTSKYTKVKVYSNCDSVALFVNGNPFDVLTSDNHIYTWPDIKLSEGENKIEVKGFFENSTFMDSCFWNYTKVGNDTLLAGDLQINFQTSGAATPVGYLPDVGAAFGNRGNGYSYGWTPVNTVNTRERNFSPDQRFNTFNHMQRNDVNYTWEITVDNGVYLLGIGCGDPDYTDSYHKISAEGKLVLEGFHTNTSMKVSTDTVTVRDGRLTISPAPGASNTKINLIHITKLDSILPAKLEIQNGSFELPTDDVKFRADGVGGAMVFNGNVPGWWADPGATDCGRQNTSKPAHDGNYTAFAYNNDGGSIWAIAGTVPENMRDLVLSFYAWESFPQEQTGVDIVAKFAVYEGSDPENFTLLETLTIPFSSTSLDNNGWGNFIYSYTLPKSTVGKNLLIGFDIVTQSNADSWFSFDNFTLSVSPVTAVIDNASTLQVINVFPNPARDYLTILMDPNTFAKYTFYDVSGRPVLSGSIADRNHTINLNSLNKGIYFLKVENPLGTKVIKTIVKW
ncbi:glycoside hydrolase family 2 TIM barrel-domain containing protein [Maribellus mangrovi]|uniref:glycoside hydrolase family 2 TIM barrel-domain containing protein n=1 Tax=Maribellus mangrovi TaxID=3133146 RepID=UPI0030EC4144